MRRREPALSPIVGLPTICSVSIDRSLEPHHVKHPHVVHFDCLNFEVDGLLCNRVEVQVWTDFANASLVSDREDDCREPDAAMARWFERLAVNLLAAD